MTKNTAVLLGCLGLVILVGAGLAVSCLVVGGATLGSFAKHEQKRKDAWVEGTRGLSLFATQGDAHILVADPELAANRQRLSDSLRLWCNYKSPDWCMLLVWSSDEHAPRALPMSDEAVAAQIASYTRNRATGRDRVLLCEAGSCSDYP